MYFPAEITEEILVKLSVKTLLRFKCVCKSWRSLITSRRFIRRHYSDSSNQSCLLIHLFGRNVGRPYSFSIYDASNHPRIQESNLLQQMPTCHGVFTLFGPENGVFCTVYLSGVIFLSNPAMRELRLLPPAPFDIIEGHIGFGFDPSTGDLKVAAFGSSKHDSACVYSSSSDSWKIIEMDGLKVWCIGTVMCEAFLNGVYYWCMHYIHRSSSSSSSNTAIVALDMRSDKVQVSRVPESIPYSRWPSLRIVEYGDSIALICVDNGEDGLWVMGKDGIWSRKKKDLLTEARVLLIEERREIEARIRNSLPVFNFYSYKESLVSVKGGRGDAAFLQDLFRDFVHQVFYKPRDAVDVGNVMGKTASI